MMADDTPNSDSMRWFIREVWPRVTGTLGAGVKLHLVGTCTAASVLALAGPQVVIHGQVESLADHLDRARLFIVPTRYAAGIPHKAHEAAARGLPMVVTRLIAEQLGWQDFVANADSAEAFAAHCVNLHQNSEPWQHQREAICSAMLRDCSPERFRSTLNLVLAAQ